MVDPEVLRYYETGLEADRLIAGDLDRLEFIRTKELLARRLSEQPLDILDVGGASGRYASWLAGLGHRVHLIDPVPLHLDQARAIAAANASFEVSSGDARSLAFADGSFDVVLLLGPLYHLVERNERLSCLREARRVLRQGGWLAAAAISRFASSFDGIVKGFATDPSFRGRVEHALVTGTHRNDAETAGQFTTAFFHRPEELRAELASARFHVDAVYGVEGPGGYQADDGPDWLDESYRAYIVELARLVETEPSVLGFGPHLLAMASPTSSIRST
jgi:SAM-dependent methyltransferase